ncbi:odorant receptor 46a-like [Belonocnema kinseyi]|uniref:odorant receptor 46a-like n=1 Tax=Belonocnema kinseyi TaxID=2817044 RepID=UPI00143D4FC0|nr:odorant receptor 46a-like [Belonocnema kinseyi]
MYFGQLSYTVFQYFGMLRPLTWNSQWKIWIYRIYSIFMISIYSIFTFSILIYLLQDIEEIVNNMETLFHFLAVFAVLIKLMSIMVKRKTLIESKNMLLDEVCQPRDFYESELLKNCSKVCRSNTIIFLFMTNISALSVLVTPPSKRSNFPLPFKVWIPYSLNSRLVYSLTYFHQGVAITMAAFITASVEGLASVIMLQICAQLEIIVHRLHLLSQLQRKYYSKFIDYQDESKLMKDCVDHHIYTYMLGEKLNELFGLVIFVQFFASMIGLCAVIYPLSKLSINNPSSWRLIFILLTALVQIFLYCFYGEKLMKKSMDISKEVYQIDWIETTIRTKKDLTLLMIRAGKPINLTGLSLITMKIDTFVKILKSAYSAYNLLKSS